MQIVEFAHREELIQQLTASLQQSLMNREELQQQCQRFANEITDLQQKLYETAEIIKNHKCHISDDESENKQLNSLSDVPSDLREFLEKYIKQKLDDVEEIYRKQIEEYEVGCLNLKKLICMDNFLKYL